MEDVHKGTQYKFVFDEFELYPGERLLLRNNSRMSLSGKDFDVLVHLVSRPKRLVSRIELLNVVWKDIYVEEGNLTTRIYRVRQVLKDTSKNPRYIESVKGYGYRFLRETKQVEFDEALY